MELPELRKRAETVYIRYFKEGRYLKRGVKCPFQWFGNGYGGFYVCPIFINQNSVVYSFGIGEDLSFSLGLITTFQCRVYGFDPTPRSIEWVQQQKLPETFYFTGVGIDKVSGRVRFFLPRNPRYVSGSRVEQSNVSADHSIEVSMKRFIDIASDLEHQKIDILKLDIEGSEHEVISDVLQSGIEISQILIEFHDRFMPNGKEKTIQTVKELRKFGYEIFAVSNTCQEVSFIKTALLKSK